MKKLIKIYENDLNSFFESIKSFCFRKLKKDSKLNLPKKEFIKVHCEFEPIQKNMYNSVKNELRLIITKDKKQIEENQDILKESLDWCR